MFIVIRSIFLAVILGTAISVGSAFAQTLPSGPLRLVVPFSPGGVADILARSLSEHLAQSLGHPVVVDNRGGGGGNIGAYLVAKAPPDGRTLLVSSASPLTMNQFLYPRMPFDPETAFVPVSNLAGMSQLMVVHPESVASFKELLDKGRAQPERFVFGSAGLGSVAHLSLELFMQAADIRFVHVPYKGAAPAVRDLIGGQINGIFTNPPLVISHLAAKRVRAMALAGKKRIPALPDVPTFAEVGFPGFEALAWFGIVAPAGTPEPVVQQLNRLIVEALGMPAMQQRINDMGAEPFATSVQEFDQFIRAERKKWGNIIRSAGVKLE